MTHEEVMSMMGVKFYRSIDEDNFEILRVINIKGSNECICLMNGEKISKTPEEILSNYVKLIPDGIITFAAIETKINQNSDKNVDDVIVMVRTMDNIENDIQYPDLICRQNIVDIFYELSHNGDETDFVGTSICRSQVPHNMPMELFTRCDKVNYIVTYNTYISDTPLTFIEFMKGKRLNKFDTLLENNLGEYLKSNKLPDIGQKSVKGYCRNLETLLKNNNFCYDYDSLYNITPIKDNLEDNLEKNEFSNGMEYMSLNSKFTNIFSNIFKMKILKTIVVKYDHDIDLSEFDENTIFLIRDNTSSLYVVRYTIEGKYLESELEIDMISQAFEHINLINKYGKKSKSQM